VPLRVRLALFFALATAVLVAGGGTLAVARLHAALVASVDAGLRARADNLVEGVTAAGGTVDFQDTGPEGLIFPNETLGQVIGADGRVLQASDPAPPARLLDDAQLARARRRNLWLTTGGGRQARRLLAVPIGNGADGRVAVVGASLKGTDDAIGRVRTELVLGGIVLLALSAAGSWLLAGAALRPVERMRRQASEMSERTPSGGLDVPPTHDEIAALARTLNDLLARREEALALQREFVVDAGHELRTPLAILQAELELAGRPGRSHAELTAAVAAAAEETQRLAALAEDLLLLARGDGGRSFLDPRPCRLDAVVEEAVQAASGPAASSGVELRCHTGPGLEATVDARRVRQALDNLLDNALRFAPARTAVEVDLRGEGGLAVLEVADAGPGFPEDFLPHAFERFRRASNGRTREDGGTGLGLSIVAAIANAHGGRVVARNRSTGGAAVRIEVPLHGPVPGDDPKM
jgi:signal transduction histidine kinase